MEENKLDRASENSNNVVIKVENLTVWTPEEKSWWRQKPHKPRTYLLNNISGCMKSGEFVAVLGPSGAGKTTYLVSLAGKCTLPSVGSVTVNGVDVEDLQRGVVEIVPQKDVFMEALSVIEHLVFMTEMKLGSVKKPCNRAKLDTLISEFKLQPHEDTAIGSLSGGERRLLSLATSFLCSPHILICDEPTTGLDSFNASVIIGVLKRLTQGGKLVICSVHQPSSDLFKEFSSISLMAEGKLMFHGRQDECRILFESLNLHCPTNYNPAEFYIKAVSSSNHENHVDQILENNRSRHYRTGSDVSPLSKFQIRQRNWLKQVHLLLWRSSLTLKRSTKNYLIQLLLTTVVSSVIISACFVGITGTTQRGVQDLRGFLWLVCAEVSFSVSYNALFIFADELTLFKREIGTYSISAYFVSMFLSVMPRCVIWPVSYIIIAASAVRFPNHILTTLKITAALIGTAVSSTAYGLGMGALFTSSGIMGDVMPCADLPFFLMSGAFLRLSSLPSWLYPFKYLSHFYYGMDLLSNIYWRQIDHIDCPYNSTAVCYKDGVDVLMETGYSTDFIFEDSVGQVAVVFAWGLLGYYGLNREYRKGFVY